MCGLVGIIGNQNEVIEDVLQNMEHRGSDNRGVYHNGRVSLGHNRLSINDLSDKGNQPFHYQNIHLIVNGEIWNYPALKKEYENNISILSEILNIDKNNIKYMSHPNGSYNADTLKILQELKIELGFKQIMTIEPEKNMKKVNNSSLEIARQDHANIIKMMN